MLVTAAIILSTFVGTYCSTHQKHSSQSIEIKRKVLIDAVSKEIAGRENEPVEQVFKNLKDLSGFPAENLIYAMDAWSKALGVSCEYCHDTKDYSLDGNLKKQIAREMVRMGNTISEKLKTIEGLSSRPVVNCYTCHRGSTKPALRSPNTK